MRKKAIFAAGCFWGVEEAFMDVDGVLSTVVGYIGGDRMEPTYEEVCYGDTGHAEAVEIFFDDEKISYDNLLDTFWAIHDPTLKEEHGTEKAYQYRSSIFYIDEQQKEIANKSKEKYQQFYEAPIVTEIIPATEFFKAEDYHQHYFQKTGKSNCSTSCHMKFE